MNRISFPPSSCTGRVEETTDEAIGHRSIVLQTFYFRIFACIIWSTPNATQGLAIARHLVIFSCHFVSFGSYPPPLHVVPSLLVPYRYHPHHVLRKEPPRPRGRRRPHPLHPVHHRVPPPGLHGGLRRRRGTHPHGHPRLLEWRSAHQPELLPVRIRKDAAESRRWRCWGQCKW